MHETPRSQAEPQAAGDRGPDAAPKDAGGDESASQATGTQAIPLGALAAPELLVWVLSLLAVKAWEGMGLVPNPATNKIQKNLDDARIAIDAYGAILDVVRARLENGPRRETETLLTTLRLNFVEKSGET